MKNLEIRARTNGEIPNLSIITPTYNRAWCIERAIKSVLQQEFQNWELIIIDDGSVDNTKDIIEKYLLDPRVRYFYKENGGVGSARNVGIRYANGDLVMFLDSDDELLPDALTTISSAISKHKNRKLYSFRAVDTNGNQVSYASDFFDDLMIDFSQFISRKYIRGESFLVFENNVFNGNFFDEDVNGGESLLLFKLIKENGVMMINADVRIYHTESNDSLISSRLTSEKIQNICKIQKLLIKRYKDDLKHHNRRYLGTAYLVLARALALSGRRIASLKCFFIGCFYNIFDVKRILLYGVSLFDYGLRLNNALNTLNNRKKLL